MLEEKGMDEEMIVEILDRAVRDAKEKVVSGAGKMSDPEIANPLMLKMLMNHIDHLDMEIKQELQAINQRFEKIDQRFEKIDQRFEEMGRRFDGISERFVEVHKQIAAQTRFTVGGIAIIAVIFKLADLLI